MKKTLSYIALSLFYLFNFSPFTVLAQDLYIGSLYVTSSDEEKLYGDGNDKWATRMPIICDMLNFEQPDVMGLQSLTSTQLSQVTRRMSKYQGAGTILYNTTVTLDSSGTVEEMPEGSTCSWARLQKDGTDFYVFNICFAPDNSIAYSSASRVITAIGEINTDKLPCFIIGNLGVDEKKNACSKFTTRYNDCFTTAPIVSAEFGTMNGFDLDANHGTERYDFIFAPKSVTVKAYGQLQYGYYTKESDGSYKRRLPSSHFPVMAKVSLSK